MVLNIILVLAALASIAMWLTDMLKNRRRLQELIYPGLAILFAASSAFLYARNESMLSPTAQAKMLADSWPLRTYDGNFHRELAHGIVQAGLRYLESYKEQFPESYNRFKEEYDRTDFTDNLEATHAGDTMIVAIRSYAGLKVSSR